MISTPLVDRPRRLLVGLAAAFTLCGLTACATPMWRGEARTTEDTLPPMAGTVAPSPVAAIDPLVDSAGPLPVARVVGARSGSAIDQFAEPSDPVAQRLTAGTRAAISAYFPTLEALLDGTSLGVLTDGHGITLLAPTEVAFAHLPGDYVRNIVKDRDDVDHVLGRHILDGVYTYEQLGSMKSVLTISGDSLDVSHGWDGTVFIDGARVSRAIPGSNADLAVFPVDKVLVDRL